MKTCSFAGHRDVFASGVESDIQNAIEKILADDEDFVFYTGGMGQFDSMCSAAVRAARRAHADKNIKLILVEPYMKTEINENKDYYAQSYDDVVIPMELAGMHFKSAIPERNKWMIDCSDYLIAFVYRSFGGAYDTLKYAKKKDGITIFNVGEKERTDNG